MSPRFIDIEYLQLMPRMQAMRRTNMQHASRSQDAMEFLCDHAVVANVFQNLETDDLVKCANLFVEIVKIALFETKSLRIGVSVINQKVFGLFCLRGFKIQRDDTRSRLISQPRKISVATACVEQIARARLPELAKRCAITRMEV